jgi:hypothetical protein
MMEFRTHKAQDQINGENGKIKAEHKNYTDRLNQTEKFTSLIWGNRVKKICLL